MPIAWEPATPVRDTGPEGRHQQLIGAKTSADRRLQGLRLPGIGPFGPSAGAMSARRPGARRHTRNSLDSSKGIHA